MMMLNLGDSGGGGGGQLNKDLAAQNQQGKNLFSTPFGDKTVFHTKDGGVVLMTFIFDPDHSYNSSATTASVTPDYWMEIRKELTKHVVDKSFIKPSKPLESEAVWQHVRSSLPKEVLTQYFKEHPNEMQEYVNILKTDAKLDYVEDTKLTEAMQSTNFVFKYEIAIDAYPASMDKNSSRRSSQEMEVPHGRKGVLTFYIQGIRPDQIELAAINEAEEKASSSSSSSSSATTEKVTGKKNKTPPSDAAQSPSKRVRIDDSEAKAAKAKAEDSTEGGLVTPKAEKLTLKRVNTALPKSHKRNQKSMKEFKKLVVRLGLTKDLLYSTPAIKQKEFTGATEFFEAVDKWFGSSVDNKATQIKKAESDKLPSLYN